MAINLAGYDKAESEVLYDTQSVTSGQAADLNYFQQTITATGKYATTNMLQASRMPGNEEFGVRNFETLVAIACPPEDLAQIYNNGWIEVIINRETPFAMALRFIPAGSSPRGVDNRAAAAGQVGVQWYADGRLFRLAKSLRFPEGSNFYARVKFGTAPALVAARDLTVGYHGVRASAAEVR